MEMHLQPGDFFNFENVIILIKIFLFKKMEPKPWTYDVYSQLALEL